MKWLSCSDEDTEEDGFENVLIVGLMVVVFLVVTGILVLAFFVSSFGLTGVFSDLSVIFEVPLSFLSELLSYI